MAEKPKVAAADAPVPVTIVDGAQPTTAPLPQTASVKKIHQETQLEHDFPKMTWDLLGPVKQKEFEDVAEKPEVVKPS